MNDNKEKDLAPIGFCNFRNQKKKFGIKLDDRRRHVYIVGKTGVGKTTLLENMAIADIKAGRGLAVVDPHGEFAERVLDFVPEERMDDVIYFNPADMEFPIAFNPMEQVNPEFRHLVASGLMGVFKKIFVDVWSARMAYILNNTLLALLELPGSTLLGIMRMLSEPAYRKKIVENLRDPVVKAFWVNEFARYTQRLETEAVAAIQNKVGQFISNPLIRNILGQPNSTLNMREIMDKGKIFIVNLSKGRIGEDNSALLGAMVITRLQLAAMSRVDMPEEQRRDFFLYVDEFQNFATDSFANILSEARKYRLSLILAHQYIGQLITDQSTKVRDSVFGNVGTIINFRVGGADAEFLETEFMPEFLQNDLVNLAKANVYIKLMIDGVASRPFSAETMPPQKTPLLIYRDVIIKNSRERYGTRRKIVEDKIAAEWQTGSETLLDEKISRQGERPLRQTLQNYRPQTRPAYGGQEERRSSPAGDTPRPWRPADGEARSWRPETTRAPLGQNQPGVVSLRPARHTSEGAAGGPVRPERGNQIRPVHQANESNDSARTRSESATPIHEEGVSVEDKRARSEPARQAAEIQPSRPMPPPVREVAQQPQEKYHLQEAHPKVHPKVEVNIDELRKAINESLRKIIPEKKPFPSVRKELEQSAGQTRRGGRSESDANRPVPPPIIFRVEPQVISDKPVLRKEETASPADNRRIQNKDNGGDDNNDSEPSRLAQRAEKISTKSNRPVPPPTHQTMIQRQEKHYSTVIHPQIHTKTEANIDELRKTIKESLDNNILEKPVLPPVRRPPVREQSESKAILLGEPILHKERADNERIQDKDKTEESSGDTLFVGHGNDGDYKYDKEDKKPPLYGTDEDRDELNINPNVGEETLSLEELAESEEKKEGTNENEERDVQSDEI